ncbi:MAG: diguanylate cyclase [Pseudomonadales bacterium]|nr:diguanylate cyclase [Pseudomonadales bacterium]
MLQITYWSIPSLVAIVLAVATLVRIRQSGPVPGARALTALGGCVVLWSLGQLIGSLTTSLELKILASKLQYPAIGLLPATWLMFATTYIRGRQAMAPLKLALLVAVPCVTVLLAWTNELHGMLWAAVTLRPTPGFVGLAIDYGPWFRVHMVYSYALVLAATLLLRLELPDTPRTARARAAVVQAPLAIVLLNLLHLSPWNPVPFIDPTPLGLAIGTWILNRGVLRTGLLETPPQLHRQVVEQLGDGIAIVDRQGQILDLNQAARRCLMVGDAPITGRSLVELATGNGLAEVCAGRAESGEITVGSRTYHVRGTVLETGRTSTPCTVLVLRDITERRAAEDELLRVKQEMETLAHTDPLTGLSNRRYFMQRLHEEIERARRHGHPLSVALLDLDHFKIINDTFGHDAGDQVLRAVARTIFGVKRSSDVAARFGGEEFALLLPETDPAGAARVAERLREAIESLLVPRPAGAPLSVTTSIGVATLHSPEAGLDNLLIRADRALYDAKRAGRNRVCDAAA